MTDLARIADLKVIGRTSVEGYPSGEHRDLRAIGRQLGVAHCWREACNARVSESG